MMTVMIFLLVAVVVKIDEHSGGMCCSCNGEW